MSNRKRMHEEFLQAYDTHADALFRFVSLRTRDRENAVDIVQETYVRTWQYLTEGNTIDQLRAFLFKTAKNMLIDKTTQAKRRNTGSLDLYMEEGGDIPDDTGGREYDPMDGERILSLLATLEPVEYREIIYLRFMEELGLSEIAEILGVSENVVSVRINRAIAKLRKIFPYEPNQ